MVTHGRGSEPPVRDAGIQRARATLRALLAGPVPLRQSSIDRLVRHAGIVSIRAGHPVTMAAPPELTVSMSLYGALKLVCAMTGHRHHVVRYFSPGRFIWGPRSARPAGYRVVLVAHEDACVALFPLADVAAALSEPGGTAGELRRWGMQGSTTDLCEVGALPGLGLLERILYGLRHLATELPDPGHVGPGVGIRCPITHGDVAALVGGTRAAVCRCMGMLQRAGLVHPGARRQLAVAQAVLTRDPLELVASLAPGAHP